MKKVILLFVFTCATSYIFAQVDIEEHHRSQVVGGSYTLASAGTKVIKTSGSGAIIIR